MKSTPIIIFLIRISPPGRGKSNIFRTLGLYSSVNEFTRLLHALFLSDPTFLSLATTKKWLRALFTNLDFASEVGMPWEISIQELNSGRISKIYGKGGDLITYHSFMSINRALGFSVKTVVLVEFDTRSLLLERGQMSIALASQWPQICSSRQYLRERYWRCGTVNSVVVILAQMILSWNSLLIMKREVSSLLESKQGVWTFLPLWLGNSFRFLETIEVKSFPISGLEMMMLHIGISLPSQG